MLHLCCHAATDAYCTESSIIPKPQFASVAVIFQRPPSSIFSRQACQFCFTVTTAALLAY
jgi:hypothetical protein